LDIGEKRLKILHIADWHPSRENPTGGIFVREHIRTSALYEDVCVLVTGDGAKLKVFSPLFKLIPEDYEDGIPTFRLFHKKLPTGLLSYLIYTKCTILACERLLKEGIRADIIHAHEFNAGVPAVMLGRKWGIPVVISEHWSGFATGKLNRVKFIKARYAFEKADVVCPVSENLRKHIEKAGIKASFRVIPNAVDVSLFHPSDPPRARGGRKALLCVAQLTPIKGIPHLFEALLLLRKKRDDFTLHIVGDGPNRKEYEEMVKSLGLNEVVRFYGLQPKKKVAEFMRQADLFVLPSLWENLPCVLIEAMASGLPIVSTNVGGIPEIVDEETGVLVPPKNPEKLSEAINYVLDNLENFPAEKTVKRARERYSYEAVGKVFSDLYREIISGRNDRK
jgi:glycosyltransferase involved in cell wall biosynthesis